MDVVEKKIDIEDQEDKNVPMITVIRDEEENTGEAGAKIAHKTNE